jgi:hypothetical protein
MLVPQAVPHTDLALKDSVSVEPTGQARTAAISWSLLMVMRKTTSMLTNASIIAPKEECASLVCASARRVGQASHATWQLSVWRIAIILQGPALLAHVSVQQASSDLAVVTKNVQEDVSVMDNVIQASVIVRRVGQVALARTR